MKDRLLVIAIFLVTVSILINSYITAKNTATLNIKPQLEAILNSQKAIEQKLSAIEKNQQELSKGSNARLNDMAKMFPPPEDFTKQYTIDVGNSSIEGKKDAVVTIVEFSDFQCPFSKRFHSVIQEVLKEYPNDVNFIFKNFPLSFHKEARPAAKASLAAAEQGKYWEMVKLLFESSPDLGEEKYKQLAAELSLDVDKFMKDYMDRDAEWDKLINEDISLAGKTDVRGTPTFFINGRKTKARNLASFKTEIDKILNKEE